MMILGTGVRSRSVETLARETLPIILKGLPTPLEPADLAHIKGIGTAKASVLSGCLELSRRCHSPIGKQIRTPADAYPFIAHFAQSRQEHFISIPLNGAHEVLGVFTVTIGLVNRTVVHPREVFAPAIEVRAAAVIVAHNHPSGNLQPSTEDRDVTNRLKSAGDILGIPILDHLIFSAAGYLSLLEAGML